jgi:hypothetical protein
MELPININLTKEVLTNWQILNNNVNSFNQSAQQFGQSLKATAQQTTDQAINTVTTTLANSWQTAVQIKNSTSGAIDNAISNSVNDFVTQHPAFLQFLQILGWANNHPIISLVIFIFLIASAGSIIKAIIRLIETVIWLIFKVPLQLIQALATTVFLSITKFVNLNLNKNIYPYKIITPVGTNYQNKQQRLAEIYQRLETIQAEQQQLLKEAANLIESEKYK